MTYTQQTYDREREIVDKADAYARATMATRGPRCNYLTKEEAAAPVYAMCSNDMRGRVEQFELLRDRPDKFCAYLSDDGRKVVCWPGNVLGSAVTLSSRRIGGWVSGRYYYGRATIGGREYAWLGHGAGMLCRLKALKGGRA